MACPYYLGILRLKINFAWVNVFTPQIISKGYFGQKGLKAFLDAGFLKHLLHDGNQQVDHQHCNENLVTSPSHNDNHMGELM